jgi:hypothetical protein
MTKDITASIAPISTTRIAANRIIGRRPGDPHYPYPPSALGGSPLSRIAGEGAERSEAGEGRTSGY